MSSPIRVITLLLAALLLVPAAATSATADPEPRQGQKMTRLTIKVKGCIAECWVLPSQRRSNEGPAWHGRAKEVQRGKVTLRVPTARTKGMSFEVTSSMRTFTEYRSFVATRYAGRKTGSKVSVRRAARAHKGSGCWAGTTKRRKTLTVKVRYFQRYSGYTGQEETDMRVWATRTLRATPGSVQLTGGRGAVGTQDSPMLCPT